MAAELGNAENVRNLDGRNLPCASTVVMQYTGYSSVSASDGAHIRRMRNARWNCELADDEIAN